MSTDPASGRAPRVLGLMSGTSADGIDAVLLELPGWPGLDDPVGREPDLSELPSPRGRILGKQHLPYSDELRTRVLEASQNRATTSEIAQLHMLLGQAFAEAALPLAHDADLIASHGQTVHHIATIEPHRGWHTRATLQLGEAAVIAERTGKPVIADFRPADLAAGGQAAPLVPFADRILYGEHGIRRAVHNLGGISNLTYLPGLNAPGVIAFDTGPGNALIDEAAALIGQRMDDGGQLAASGRVDLERLHAWLRHSFFALKPPKSTGRELWTLAELPGAFELAPADLAATVTALSAHSIAQAYRDFVLPLGLDEIIIAGGGAHNPFLVEQLRAQLATHETTLHITTFEERGWHSSTREAAAFAVLGYYAARGWPNTLPQATGARHATIAGKFSRPPARTSL